MAPTEKKNCFWPPRSGNRWWGGIPLDTAMGEKTEVGETNFDWFHGEVMGDIREG